MSAPFWVDIMSDIVTEVRSDATKPAALAADAPYYEYGHPNDVINLLKQKDNSETYKYKKYPLIALFQDFTEDMGYDQKVRSRASLNMVICVNTSANYYASERYDNSFRDTLYPLYDLLIDKIETSGWFRNTNPLLADHQKIDRLYWGRSGLYGNEGNIFNDYIDAIEIQNLQLEMKWRKC